jgi:hypothetical protein
VRTTTTTTTTTTTSAVVQVIDLTHETDTRATPNPAKGKPSRSTAKWRRGHIGAPAH